MKINDEDLRYKLDSITKNVENEILAILNGRKDLGFIDDEEPGLLLSKLMQVGIPHNIFSGFILEPKLPLPKANFLLYFLKSRDFGGLDAFIRNRKWQNYVVPEEMRKYVPMCETYVENEIKNTGELEAEYLKATLAAAQSPGTCELF